MAEILIIGGINIDIEGYPYSKLKKQDSNPGRVKLSYGGVGRNIAENAARLGADVAMVSAIGKDESGRGAKAQLKELGVDVSLVREIAGCSSAMYLSILNDERDMELGVCDMEILEKITPEYLLENYACFADTRVVALDGNLREEQLKRVIELFPDKKLFFDPVSASKAYRAKDIIGAFHSIKPNLIEAEVLSGIRIETKDDIRRAASRFTELGVENVFITLNTEGVYFKNKAKEGFIKPPKYIKIESATGAGDAFSSVILLGMANGSDIEEIARLGMAASQVAMESEKAVSDKMNFDEIKRRIYSCTDNSRT